MDIYEELEYTLPVLKVNTDNIKIEAYKYFESSFNVQNIGGSLLKGELISDCPEISFDSLFFEGNKCEIKYFADLKSLKPLEEKKARIIVISNGGQAIINVSIKTIPPFLSTKTDMKISDLNELYEYYKYFPTEARFLFSSRDFMFWLKEIDYKNMELYEHFIKDPNKERGLDSFFRANGIGNRVFLEFTQDKYILKLKEYDKDVSSHTVVVNKKGFGYIKTNLKTVNNSNWINLETRDISSLDFESKDYANVNFFINAKNIKSDFVSDSILLEDYKKELKIEIYKKAVINVKLSKQSFEYEDMGFLIVENNYFKDITLEVVTENNFVKFEGKTYLVGNRAEIKFDIKVSAFAGAQAALKRQPVLRTSLIVRAFLEDRVVIREIKFSIGNIIA